MRRFYFRFRTALMTFALGLAVVYMTNGLSVAWDEIPVDLPEARSSAVLPIFPADAQTVDWQGPCVGGPTESEVQMKIRGTRDMSLYDIGGDQGCGLTDDDSSFRQCNTSLRYARNFIVQHWTERKRGYIVVKRGSVDAESDAHIFIEPDEEGNWRIAWTWERIVGFASCPGDVDKTPDIRNVVLKRATRNDWEFPAGTFYLDMIDDDGDSRTL